MTCRRVEQRQNIIEINTTSLLTTPNSVLFGGGPTCVEKMGEPTTLHVSMSTHVDLEQCKLEQIQTWGKRHAGLTRCSYMKDVGRSAWSSAGGWWRGVCFFSRPERKKRRRWRMAHRPPHPPDCWRSRFEGEQCGSSGSGELQDVRSWERPSVRR